MCGIAGIVNERVLPAHIAALGRMMNSIAHRGPDGEGQHVFNQCALGHRRLAIVDILTGKQPMVSSHGRVAITFNGEIYGYKPLRRSLSEYPFRTESDTEVILALYERYGRQAVDHIPGMFAFAIWDDQKKALFCARDRFGEKPFYYATGRSGEFLFGSEVKAIIASGMVDPVLDGGAIARYLQRQCVRPDQSIYSNIKALPPGHALWYHGGRCHIYRYWDIPKVANDITLREAGEELDTLLRAAVDRQLVADVPVGAFLSGGLDSSTVCLIGSDLKGDLQTFSFDFEGEHSEVEFARAVATAYGTRHTELSATHDTASEVVRMQRIFDEPFGDSASIPTFLLSREARRHVKVALTGDGGDELFGGYAWYLPIVWMKREGKVGLMKWVVERAINRISKAVKRPGAVERELRIMGLAFARQHASPIAAHHAQLSFFNETALALLGLPYATPYLERQEPAGSIDDVLLNDVVDYMPANNLTRTDRASMANGLELRAPFLDMELATFCLTLPYRMKISTTDDKIILRRAFETRWPEVIRHRKKQGFGAPLKRWLAEPGMIELRRQFLLDTASPMFDVLPFKGVQKILKEANPIQEWTLMMLAVWFGHRKDSSAVRLA